MQKISNLLKRMYVHFRMPILRVIKASPPRLEFGCGPSLQKEFTGVDIRFFEGVEFICNAWEIKHYVKGESVEEIRSRHFLEHLTYSQAQLALLGWNKILKPGGHINIIIPDINYHLDQFRLSPASPAEFDSSFSNMQHAIAGFYGWQREGLTKLWDVHKSGYNLEIISTYLIAAGFTHITRNSDKPWNLNVTATKK